MRAAPPLQFSVNRFGLWRGGVTLLAGCTCAAMAAWWWAQSQPRPPWTGAFAAIAALVAVACAGGLWRGPTLVLRWDRQCWWLAGTRKAEQAGELSVAIDIGGWMLLRFVPARAIEGRAWPREAQWIAVQRRGLEGQWHALRCTLYAARPTSMTAAAEQHRT